MCERLHLVWLSDSAPAHNDDKLFAFRPAKEPRREDVRWPWVTTTSDFREKTATVYGQRRFEDQDHPARFGLEAPRQRVSRFGASNGLL
ncbi:hypothetical protein CF326_g3353 [Tilletia indica]|nr:hypothetical protein CF326_g3353 [Tilletia indica]